MPSASRSSPARSSATSDRTGRARAPRSTSSSACSSASAGHDLARRAQRRRRSDRLQAAHRLRAGGAVSLHAPDRRRIPDAGRAPARHPPSRARRENGGAAGTASAARQPLQHDGGVLEGDAAARAAGRGAAAQPRRCWCSTSRSRASTSMRACSSARCSTLLAADGRMILFSTHRFDMVEKALLARGDPVGRTPGRRASRGRRGPGAVDASKRSSRGRPIRRTSCRSRGRSST